MTEPDAGPGFDPEHPPEWAAEMCDLFPDDDEAKPAAGPTPPTGTR